jgi:hypothetical protein
MWDDWNTNGRTSRASKKPRVKPELFLTSLLPGRFAFFVMASDRGERRGSPASSGHRRPTATGLSAQASAGRSTRPAPAGHGRSQHDDSGTATTSNTGRTLAPGAAGNGGMRHTAEDEGTGPRQRCGTPLTDPLKPPARQAQRPPRADTASTTASRSNRRQRHGHDFEHGPHSRQCSAG